MPRPYYEEFFKHAVYKEFEETLQNYLIGVRDDMETCLDRDEILRYQGRAQALRLVLAHQISIQEALNFKKEKEEENGTRS